MLTYMHLLATWRGFITSAADIQRVAAFIRRRRRRHYCPIDLPDFEALMDESSKRLFGAILYTTRTILCTRSFHLNHKCLTTTRSGSVYMTGYFRNIKGHLIDKNLITRLLYKDIYRLSFYFTYIVYIYLYSCY